MGYDAAAFPKETDITPEYLAQTEARVRGMMDDRRFSHTLGVAETAAALAQRYGLSVRRATLAGLLHDCAKRMPYGDMRALAERNALVTDPELLCSENALHGFVGAFIARRDFGVTDAEILDAIRYHTFGHPGMTDLEKCVFIADTVEMRTRRFPGVEDTRRVADYSLNAAVMLILLRTRDHVFASGFPYFGASQETMEWLHPLLTQEEITLVTPLIQPQGGH